MKNLRKYVLVSFLVALIMIFTFTPLGYIMIGPIRITFVHIPVIIGSLWMGWKVGAVLGFAFGLMSLISNTITPGVVSFVFSPLVPVIGTQSGSWLALIIVFIPRILVGVVPHFVQKVTHRASLSAVAGSLTNTVLVLGLIFVLFNQAYAQARNLTIDALIGVLASTLMINGVIEAIASLLIVSVLYARVKIKHI